MTYGKLRMSSEKDEIDDLKERKVERVIAAMKKLSEDDTRFAQALRSVGLL